MDSSQAQADGILGAAAGAAAVPVPTSPSSDDAIHREMERLREMVLALSREVAIERAARDHLQQTVDAWEDREEPGDGEAAGAAGVSAPALNSCTSSPTATVPGLAWSGRHGMGRLTHAGWPSRRAGLERPRLGG